jgi:hypothetical protein|tara:strand:- start:6311 stop:6496 length:186 start_codon:yes stop_codon:yes gene_type:complete
MKLALVLIFIITTQLNCSLASTAAGSFIGNLGAELVHEKIKKERTIRMLEEDALLDEDKKL